MDEYPPRLRKVFVLGRGATLDVDAVAQRVLAERAELVLLSLGDTSATQAGVVGHALRLADELRLWLDAVLVSTPQQLAELVGEGDDVTVLASGSERRRIERALGRKGRPRMVASAPARPSRHRVSIGKHAPPDRGRSDPVSTKVEVSDEPLASNGHSEEVLPPLEIAQSESVEALAGREVAQPALETVWTKEDALARKRATLRIYLGAAPGVGKTYSMLGEGQRRRSRGTDVVVGVVHTYDRPKTIEMLQGLEVVPPRRLVYRGTTFEEMDTEAVIARRPEVVLIDELAHTNIPGSRRAKRWEDVLDILAAGVAVISTLNIQHVASLNNVVGKVTGIRQQETVPDWILDLATRSSSSICPHRPCSVEWCTATCIRTLGRPSSPSAGSSPRRTSRPSGSWP